MKTSSSQRMSLRSRIQKPGDAVAAESQLYHLQLESERRYSQNTNPVHTPTTHQTKVSKIRKASEDSEVTGKAKSAMHCGEIVFGNITNIHESARYLCCSPKDDDEVSCDKRVFSTAQFERRHNDSAQEGLNETMFSRLSTEQLIKLAGIQTTQ